MSKFGEIKLSWIFLLELLLLTLLISSIPPIVDGKIAANKPSATEKNVEKGNNEATVRKEIGDSEITHGKFTTKTKEKLRILAVFHHPGKSHFQVFLPLLEELARRGHDLTVVSYFPRNVNDSSVQFENYKDIDLSGPTWTEVIDLSEIDYSIFSSVNDAILIRDWALHHCQIALKVPGVQQLIQSDSKFDLIITELFNSDCFLGFVHKFQAPFIALTSHEILPWANERFGSPDNPSYVPASFMFFAPQMTFVQRTINALFLWFAKIHYDLFCQAPTDKIVKEAFGPDTPDIAEIAKNTSAMLVNTHYSLFGARPYSPNIIEVGGIHVRDVKPLPKDLKTFLDDASEGVLVFSWGSMIKTSTLPEKKLKAVIKVFSEIPRKVLWKWETNELPELPKNVMIKKWLPQFDLFNHPNVKAYMGHGGLLGLTEGVYVGLPMVIVPMYGDQFHNAAAAAARGAAVIVRYDELDEITLRSALDKVFNDTRYQENARELSRAYRDRPASPLETAVWWSEFIARGNGRRYLRSEGADLPWYQYYLLDVFLFLAVVLLTALYVTYRLMKFLLFLCCSRKSSKTIHPTHANGKQSKRKHD